MAEDLDDGEFWLPSQFLADDDLLVQQNNFVDTSHGRRIENEAEAGAGFPFEFPYGFGSNGFSSALSSPVESPGGSTETESDEEDYMAGLARQMAYSMLQDDEKVVPPSLSAENTKSWVLAGSPQSTLCAVGSWSVPNKDSKRGIPSRPSRVASPPSIPVTDEEVAWDLLCEAAGQVVRFRMNEEPNHHQGRGVLGPPRKPSPISVPVTNPSVGFYSNKASISHQQLQASQFQQLKQQELLKQQCSAVWGGPAKVAGNAHVHQQQVPSNTRGVGLGNGRCVRPLGLSSSAWPPLQRQQQQAAGSGMRAVFLGGSSSRRESCGTGVFLPRRIGNPSESRKKPACSTVLVPARVMQALNLDLDDLGTQPRLSGGFASEHDLMMARRNLVLCQQKQHQHQQRNLGAPQVSHEIGLLPQEWTY